ncbi:hypothetical protein VNO78_15826 [Psophocarpus tetragonolobus]|uniref:Uncharacterized protein n=1 Tax=Psophocarpus tetragonolobus TaxID=3891 RepID=A0AAN9SH67_PSOTE
MERRGSFGTGHPPNPDGGAGQDLDCLCLDHVSTVEELRAQVTTYMEMEDMEKYQARAHVIEADKKDSNISRPETRSKSSKEKAFRTKYDHYTPLNATKV